VAEIKGIFGEPNGPRPPEGRAASIPFAKQLQQAALAEMQKGRALYYWDGETKSYLPSPLTQIDFTFSKKTGKCYQISGMTKGFDTIEKLLSAIGLGGLEKKKAPRNTLGSLGQTYEMPPYEQVQVSTRTSRESKYKKFNIYDKDMTL